MHGLLHRLRQDPVVLEQYDRTIKEQLEKGIIEAVDVFKQIPSRVHYLPHHAVIRTDKTTTKLRVVYDASAKSDGPSLNSCLHKGPKLNQLILDLLLRFRLPCNQHSKDIFGRGEFNLRKFLSNSRELQQQIDCAEGVQLTSQNDTEETYAKATLGTTQTRSIKEHKILGVPWIPASDCHVFDVSKLARLTSSLQPTKRNVVSLIGKFYDPLGFLAPVTIRFKVFFQRLCRDKLEWVVSFPEELVKEWNNLVADLGEGGPISIPRNYFQHVNGSPTSITLCGFCDASTCAYVYTAMVYLAIRIDVGTNVRFVVSKTIVAPLQTQTVPRLELLSALLLSKLIVSVSESLQPILPQLKIQCYTDSQVALYWICGTNREWKPFVRNRVNDIRRSVHPSLWNHCPGISNPADLPS